MGLLILFTAITVGASLDAEAIRNLIDRLKKLGWNDKR